MWLKRLGKRHEEWTKACIDARFMTTKIQHVGENKLMHPVNDYFKLFHDVNLLVSMMLICCVSW
jgi:hypothetical protein